ncbi:MAG: hypothetical protein ACE37H_05640 [Phycisphaeraceae bacterium]
MLKIVLFLSLFWLARALVQIGFKRSSVHEHRLLLCFCAAHAIGVPSLWFLVQPYKQVSEPLALGLAMGGAFLAAPIALFVVYRPTTPRTQWEAICAGMVLLAVGSPRQAGAAREPAGRVAARP